ncbi:hypothetical protein [Saccharibacillus sp. JS10]|uniref:hypothetical protein n=1 Tax=Saccharibacillus sp. JS10 TaxID=2950552 RepID=UPI00210C1A17|nr:hypothetical protein [Saccharibacillus sp. JS10]MCQ4087608.1 hypothetical protein [Saccharibacillus sp. JS10]
MDNIILVTFKQEESLLRVVDEFSQTPSSENYSVMQAAILRKSSGNIIRERNLLFNEELGAKHLTDNLIDSMISVMSGPIGSIIGGYTAPLLDAELNARQIVEEAGMLEAIGAKLNESEWAMILLVREHNEISLSSHLNRMGASAVVRKDAALVAYEVMNARAIRSEWEERSGAFPAESDEAFKDSIRNELRERNQRNSYEHEQSLRERLDSDFAHIEPKN